MQEMPYLCRQITIRMKQVGHLIILVTLFALVACNKGRTVAPLPHSGDTPYQLDSILTIHASEPERALRMLDSALMLGNISEYRHEFVRAKIYNLSFTNHDLDSAIQICTALLEHDSVRDDPAEQENVITMLIAANRYKEDFEQYLYWASRKADICRLRGEEVELLRTEAEIGLTMTRLGQVEEGFRKLYKAINALDEPGSVDRMDALTIAVKRKINALNDLQRYDEIIPLAQRTLKRLEHYEQHARDYAEDSYRLSRNVNAENRRHYLDFARAQAWGFLAHAYAEMDEKAEAHKYLELFDNSIYGKTFNARQMIASTQIALGIYDEPLATFKEMEQNLAGDTLNEDYALSLLNRAKIARNKGHLAEALDYQTRYSSLSKQLSEELHKSEAHNYAARYHAKEQQLIIQEQHAKTRLFLGLGIAGIVLAVLAIAFACYASYQKSVVTEKNRFLAKMINGVQVSKQSAPRSPQKFKENAEFFAIIDNYIRKERLYANQTLQRQDICDHFGIGRHSLNDLLSEHTDGLTFPQYINDIRVQEALILLQDSPERTLTDIAAEVGFTPANLREQFKRKYGMTPVEYRQNL